MQSTVHVEFLKYRTISAAIAPCTISVELDRPKAPIGLNPFHVPPSHNQPKLPTFDKSKQVLMINSKTRGIALAGSCRTTSSKDFSWYDGTHSFRGTRDHYVRKCNNPFNYSTDGVHMD